mmetsp:Transcript_27432/g.84197  ORF Transcript_27432/g.84197 Transcript_27432/m.84197 type:complete len:496 (+) Transcript_27432:262-1749(+)
MLTVIRTRSAPSGGALRRGRDFDRGVVFLSNEDALADVHGTKRIELLCAELFRVSGRAWLVALQLFVSFIEVVFDSGLAVADDALFAREEVVIVAPVVEVDGEAFEVFGVASRNKFVEGADVGPRPLDGARELGVFDDVGVGGIAHRVRPDTLQLEENSYVGQHDEYVAVAVTPAQIGVLAPAFAADVAGLRPFPRLAERRFEDRLHARFGELVVQQGAHRVENLVEVRRERGLCRRLKRGPEVVGVDLALEARLNAHQQFVANDLVRHLEVDDVLVLVLLVPVLHVARVVDGHDAVGEHESEDSSALLVAQDLGVLRRQLRHLVQLEGHLNETELRLDASSRRQKRDVGEGKRRPHEELKRILGDFSVRVVDAHHKVLDRHVSARPGAEEPRAFVRAEDLKEVHTELRVVELGGLVGRRIVEVAVEEFGHEGEGRFPLVVTEVRELRQALLDVDVGEAEDAGDRLLEGDALVDVRARRVGERDGSHAGDEGPRR